MNRITLLIALTLGSLFAQAQKIRIRKGNILLNKTEKIGTSKRRYVEKLDTSIYTLIDLKGDSVNVYRIMGSSGSTTDYFYVLSTNLSDAQWELSSSDIGYDSEKGTIRYLMNKKLWNPKKGMDMNAINLKIGTIGTALSDAKNEEKTNEERVKEMNPFVRRSGEIVKGGPEGTEVIGYVESPNNYLETIVNPILIYDIDKNLIAKGKSSIIKDERFTTFDNVKHKYSITTELNEITKPLFLSEVVYLLMLEGYIYDGKVPYNPSINIFK